MADTSRKTLTVRLPVVLYNASGHLARKREVSKDRLLNKVGRLSPPDLSRVEEGLRLILGL